MRKQKYQQKRQQQQQQQCSVKSSVAFFCSLLDSLGVLGLDPELLRRAKFNDPTAALKFWRPLHDLVCLQLCCFPEAPDGNVDYRYVFQQLWKKKDLLSDADQILSFIKFFMALWGYPPNSPFFGLRVDTQESKQLLIALGWLASHCDVFLRGIEVRAKPLLKAMESVPASPPYPPDVSCMAASTASEFQSGVEQQVAKMLQAAQKVKSGDERNRFQAQQLLLLHGRVGVVLKSLHSLQICKFRRIHQLNEAQLEACSQKIQHRLYSQYELRLLQNESSCRDHFAALEAERHLKEELENSQVHEENFWKWMASVFEAPPDSSAPKVRASQEPTDYSGVSEEDLIPLIRFLRDPTQSSPVLPVPDEILARLAPAFTTKTHSSRKQRPTTYEFLNETSYKYQPNSKINNANEKIDRLKEAVEKLETGHIETRNEHRHAVERGLKTFLEDESYVIAGL